MTTILVRCTNCREMVPPHNTCIECKCCSDCCYCDDCTDYDDDWKEGWDEHKEW